MSDDSPVIIDGRRGEYEPIRSCAIVARLVTCYRSHYNTDAAVAVFIITPAAEARRGDSLDGLGQGSGRG